MGRGFYFPKWATRSKRVGSRRKAVRTLSPFNRRLVCEALEDRRLLSLAPLNVALISDAVAQAEQIRFAAAKDTIAVIYHANDMTTAGMVDFLAAVSAAHNGALIGHLAIVAAWCARRNQSRQR